MTHNTFTRLVILLGSTIFAVSYIPSSNRATQQEVSVPKPQEPLKLIFSNKKSFALVSKLVENKEYMKAIESLKNTPQNSFYNKEAKEIKLQSQLKVIETLGACQYGFDPEALQQSTFYKSSRGKYIAQVKCYLGGSQPIYEYYLYADPPAVTKPLNLVRFEQNFNKVVKKDSNLITGRPEFDRQTQELVVSQKYGGTDDCGTLGKYKFEKNEFVLQQFLADFKCGDKKLQYKKIYPQDANMKS